MNKKATLPCLTDLGYSIDTGQALLLSITGPRRVESGWGLGGYREATEASVILLGPCRLLVWELDLPQAPGIFWPIASQGTYSWLE